MERKALPEPRRIKKKRGKEVRKDLLESREQEFCLDTLNSVTNWSN